MHVAVPFLGVLAVFIPLLAAVAAAHQQVPEVLGIVAGEVAAADPPGVRLPLEPVDFERLGVDEDRGKMGFAVAADEVAAGADHLAVAPHRGAFREPAARRPPNARHRGIVAAERFAAKVVEPYALEQEVRRVVAGVIDEVIEVAPIRGEHGAAGPDLRSQHAQLEVVFDLAEGVLEARRAHAGRALVHRTVTAEDEAARVGGEHSCRTAHVAGRAQIGRDLKDLEIRVGNGRKQFGYFFYLAERFANFGSHASFLL